jgi:hypothetical protein
MVRNFTGASFYSGPQMERIVRPFVVIDSKPYDPPAPRQPLPGENDLAFISWGAPSRFITPQLTQPVTSSSRFGSGGFRVTWPEDEKPQKSEVNRIYAEISRTVDTIKVENPDDPEQYVMIERIDEIEFRAPDGSTATFKLNND